MWSFLMELLFKLLVGLLSVSTVDSWPTESTDSCFPRPVVTVELVRVDLVAHLAETGCFGNYSAQRTENCSKPVVENCCLVLSISAFGFVGFSQDKI